jgi:hypothetical protein
MIYGSIYIDYDNDVLSKLPWKVRDKALFKSQEDFNAHLASLPKWNQTKYYMIGDSLYYCENDEAVPEEELNLIMPKLGRVKDPEGRWVLKSWLENKDKKINYENLPF